MPMVIHLELLTDGRLSVLPFPLRMIEGCVVSGSGEEQLHFGRNDNIGLRLLLTY